MLTQAQSNSFITITGMCLPPTTYDGSVRQIGVFHKEPCRAIQRYAIAYLLLSAVFVRTVAVITRILGGKWKVSSTTSALSILDQFCRSLDRCHLVAGDNILPGENGANLFGYKIKNAEKNRKLQFVLLFTLFNNPSLQPLNSFQSSNECTYQLLHLNYFDNVL